MKLIDGEICIFNGKKEVIGISCKNDLLRHKQVWDLNQTPPVLLHTKSDSQVYIVWEKSEINEFAQNHIHKYYPAWKQSNILREGSTAEISKMGAFIDAVREWSNQENPAADPFDGSLELIAPNPT